MDNYNTNPNYSGNNQNHSANFDPEYERFRQFQRNNPSEWQNILQSGNNYGSSQNPSQYYPNSSQNEYNYQQSYPSSQDSYFQPYTIVPETQNLPPEDELEDDACDEVVVRGKKKKAEPKKKGTATEKKIWEDTEDEALISAFMKHSTDAIVSTNQKIPNLWKKVVADYEEARQLRPEEMNERKKDATGRLGMSALQKCTAAMRMLAYGTTADSVDEYLRMSEDTALMSLKKFCEVVIAKFGDTYLRRPRADDLAKLLSKGKERGFPGMIGSIDCMHWEWKNCPKAWKGQYQGRSGKATLILEAVASQDLWIWHAFFGMPGSCNDINVLHRSPVFDDVLEGRAQEASFVVNGHHYDKAYYLTDGIYPKWATFIQSIINPITRKDRKFQEKQEAARKDVERAFGVLQARFAIIRKPSLVWDRFLMSAIMKACIIMHNMIVEDERDSYDGYQDPTEFIEDRSAKKPRKRTSKTGKRKNPGRLYVEQDDNFKYSRERIVDINIYLANKDDVQDRNTHLLLKSDLIENIWQKYGHEDL